jgi:hypothetical protein
VIFAGRVRIGFVIAAGVEQGCPLSGAFFAGIPNAFLCARCETLGPQFLIRVLFDDVGAVCKVTRMQLPIMLDTFQQFKLATRLGLNFDKCVAIHLWPFNDPLLFHLLVDIRALVLEFSIKECPVYLG